MILYHVMSTYQLIHSMIHRHLVNPKEECHLIVSEFIADKFHNYKQLEEFFDRVCLFNNAELIREGNIIKRTNNAVEKFLNKNGINLEKYKEIIVGCAHYFFGIYLAHNNIKFTFMEDASGLVSRPHILDEIETRILSSKSKIARDLGLYDGTNSNITKVICNVKAQTPDFKRHNVVDFDLVREMKKADPSLISKVNTFFGVKELIPIKERTAIILTQHFANLRILTYQQQIRIYQFIVDFFAEGYNIVFKPHPNDLMHYDQLFSDSKVINIRFPSELMPFVFSNPPEKVITVTSTAIHNLYGLFETVDFDEKFEKSFEVTTPRYYSATKIFAILNLSNKIFEYSTEPKLLSNFLNTKEFIENNITIKSQNNLLEELDERYYIIDDYNLDIIQDSADIENFLNKVNDEAVVIFPNTYNQFVFYSYPNKNVWDAIVPIYIQHKSMETNKLLSFDVIYVYAKKEGIRKLIREINFEKELVNTGMKLVVEHVSDKDLKIKVLEGILEATEKRLERYIQLEKELREKLNNNN